MPEQRLVDMPEYKKLSLYERKLISRRLARVTASYRHPEREERMAEIVDKIMRELKAGQKVH